MKHILSFFTLVLLSCCARGQDYAVIGFSAGYRQNNYFHDGITRIPDSFGSFFFELGSFGTFAPTSGNTSDWLSHWHPLERAYNLLDTIYPYQARLYSNDDPFATNEMGYIWGFDSQNSTSPMEWILISNTSHPEQDRTWTWPEVGTGVPWYVTNSNIAIVGSVGPETKDANPNSPTYIQTALVPGIPEPSGLSLLFLGLALLSARGRSNRTVNPMGSAADARIRT